MDESGEQIDRLASAYSMPSADDAGAPQTVAVTGASGLTGSHIVKLLLERGHSVHATVRDPTSKSKCGFLMELPGASERLRLFKADLELQGSFTEAFALCTAVIHTAAVVKLRAKDPQTEIVDPAINGMKNVLECAAAAGSVKAVVITSSISALYDAPDEKGKGYVFGPADWNEHSSLHSGPYMLAKTLSEKLAWEFVGKLPAEKKFRLCTVLPSYICGPPLNTVLSESVGMFRDMLTGKQPMTPQLGFCFIDVRDVALVHVRAVEDGNANGRYICSGDFRWFSDVAKVLRTSFPQYKKLPTRNVPNFLLYVTAFFSKQVDRSFLKKFLNKEAFFDSSKTTTEFQVQFIGADQSFIDTVNALISLGCVPDLRQNSS
eukprot:ANDGO_02126.mRNA.1 Bifunctional dihydroflavonol 4-reductase/flavanone 4-reductase